ncbi:hypothetical protein N3K63_04690 [Microbacterium sp. W1N]|uniref:hypothetical protein n=1 Tax=Microbacterium festucae TaxID=2977531 RepID=UPI0021C24705|nr:hypothetical protein [Microbacterium festucae]MCT9819581.1 hypothetical protein [Microbacterium festucae]
MRRLTVASGQVAIAGMLAVVLAACAPVASAQAPEPEQSVAAVAEQQTASPAPADAPVAVTPQQYYDELLAGMTSGEVVTVDTLRAEYARAIPIFPFPLPEGYAFAADPGYVDEPDTGIWWNRSMNFMRIWSFWEGATAREALHAYERGDVAAQTALLDLLETAYRSPARPVNFDDPGLGILSLAVEPARGGDFEMLLALTTDPAASTIAGATP